MRASAPARPAMSPLRAVALPAEHGGWGLTLEPALLGLFVAPSGAGVALAAAALMAFLTRTPLKVALVDRWRHRRLPRTVLAEKVAGAELVLLGGLVVVAASAAQGRFWLPLTVAAPLVAVELWFDMRSRSRRLGPELAGAAGIGSVVAAIVLADGGDARMAAGLWIVVAARAVAAVPFVRLQLRRAKCQPHRVVVSDGAQAAAVAMGAVAMWLDRRLLAGLVAIALVAVFHAWAARRSPPLAAVLGVQQVVLGLTMVLVATVGVLTM